MSPEALAQAVADWLGQGQADLDGLQAAHPACGWTALAWALKDACYQSWNREPAVASTCARLLGELAARAPGPVHQALADWTAGIAALAQARPHDADLRLRQAQQGFAALGDALHAATVQVPLVVALTMLGRDGDAVAVAETAQAELLEQGQVLAAAKLQLNLGTLLSRADRHAEAASRYRDAAISFARAGDAEHSILADLGLSNALTWALDLDEAGFTARRARARAQARQAPVLEGLAELAQGRLALLGGQHAQALKRLNQAVGRLQAAGALGLQTAEAETALADAYATVGLLPEALQLYGRVLAFAQQAELPVEAARARLERGRTLLRLQHLDVAEPELAAARDLFAQQGNQASAALATLLLAQLQLQRGHAEGAVGMAQQAQGALRATGLQAWQLEADCLLQVARWRAGVPSDGLAADVKDLVNRTERLPQLQARAVTMAARLDMAQGQWAHARWQLDAVLNLLDQQRQALPSDEFRAGWAAQAEEVAHLLVAAHAQDPACTGDKLLAAVERGRAQAWLDTLTDAPAEPPPTASRQAQLAVQRRLRDEATAAGQGPRAAELADRVLQLEGELLEHHRRAVLDAMSTHTPGRGGRSGRVRLDLPVLQKTLAPHEAVVVYHLDDEAGSLACVVRAQACTCVRLSLDGLDDALRGLQFQIGALEHGAPLGQQHERTLGDRVRVHLQQLHRLLWAPLAGWLDGATRVRVLPHRQLHLLPFAALHDGQAWLLQTLELSLVPSLGAWLHLRARPTRRRQRLAVLGHGDAALPQVATELAQICALAPPSWQAAHDAAVTADGLRRLATGADIVHLACHGEFRADNPAYSCLHLADGPLSLHELATLTLDAELVVLSACRTGASRVDPGGELRGLVRRFTTLGARSVVAPLWAVRDDATAHLMQGLYGGLMQGQPVEQALRQAQLAMARDGLHPHHWAGFAVHGGA